MPEAELQPGRVFLQQKLLLENLSPHFTEPIILAVVLKNFIIQLW